MIKTLNNLFKDKSMSIMRLDKGGAVHSKKMVSYETCIQEKNIWGSVSICRT